VVHPVIVRLPLLVGLTAATRLSMGRMFSTEESIARPRRREVEVRSRSKNIATVQFGNAKFGSAEIEGRVAARSGWCWRRAEASWSLRARSRTL